MQFIVLQAEILNLVTVSENLIFEDGQDSKKGE